MPLKGLSVPTLSYAISMPTWKTNPSFRILSKLRHNLYHYFLLFLSNNTAKTLLSRQRHKQEEEAIAAAQEERTFDLQEATAQS